MPSAEPEVIRTCMEDEKMGVKWESKDKPVPARISQNPSGKTGFQVSLSLLPSLQNQSCDDLEEELVPAKEYLIQNQRC